MLEGIIGTANALAGDIRIGRLRARLNLAEFPGAFSELALAVNTVSDSYTIVIDLIPVPVMACHKTCGVAFLNTAGDGVFAAASLGPGRGYLMPSPQYNTPSASGIQAM